MTQVNITDLYSPKEGMIMRISTNIPGMISRRNLSNINNQLKTSIERLSSGFRINSAADDPQGLAISQRLRTVISSYEKNLENTQGGITMMQTADGNMDSLSTIISRIRDLTVLSASGDKTDEDRYMYQVEVNTLMEEYTSIVTNSEYNGIKLLDGSLGMAASVAGDIDNIADDSKITINGDVIQTGQYDIEVKRMADKATAYLHGDTAAVLTDANKMYEFVDAVGNGSLSLTINVNGTATSVIGDVEDGAGDTISEFVSKINDALTDAGIEASAQFAGADIEPIAGNNQPGISITSDKYGSDSSITLSFTQNYGGPDPTAINSTPDIALTTVANESDLSATTKTDLEITLGDFVITDRNDTSETITVGVNETISDILANINAVGGAAVTGVFNVGEQRIEIMDASGGIGTLKIEESGGGNTAGDLGILGEATGNEITGKSLSRTRDFVLEVTAPDSSTATVLGNYKDSDTNFDGLKNLDVAIADSGSVLDGTQVSGGIAGVTFALEESGIALNNQFSILVQGSELELEVAPVGGADARFGISLGNMKLSEIGLLDDSGNYDISSQPNAQLLLGDDDNPANADTALNKVLLNRAKAGAYQNALTGLTTMISDTITTLSAADTRISGTDYAAETMRFTTLQIMQQGAIYGLTQSSVNQSYVLDLLTPLE